MARCVMYAQCEKSIAGVAHSGLCIFRAVCLGMCFSGSCLLGDVDFGTSLLPVDLLGVDLLGSVRQECL